MIRDKLLISDIRIHTRFCSCVRFHKYRNVRFWILDSGFWILDSGFWILDSGFWILDSGFWIHSCIGIET